jgi:cytochrome b involved in lipid metabolism
MRILASLLLTIALAGCAQAQEPAVTEMPSAQVDAPQSETTADPMEAEGGEANEGNESAEPTNEATAESTSEPKKEQSAEPSPSPSPTKTTEPAPTKTAEPSPSPTKTQAGYTLAQVAQKNSQSACWVAIDGMVYDLTDWIRQHPGGRGAILSLCGTDGTSSFNAQHGGRAGPSAALDRYVLGPLTN